MGVAQPVVGALEVGGVARQQTGQNVECLIESVKALAKATELDPVGVGFLLVPARAQADVDTSGDAVEQSFAKLLRIVTPLLGERRL